MRRLVVRRLGLIGLLVCMAACTSAPPAAPQRFVVYFQEWSAALDDSAQGTVAAAAKWAADHPNQSVAVNGFADPEGSKQANIDISRTRAQLVVDQLVKDGVSQQRIRLGAKGPTDFTLSSQESRRVEIAIGS